MTGYYSRPARLARQMRQLLFPRRCPCCRRVLGTLPFCEVCTPRLEELRRGPVMRLDAHLPSTSWLSVQKLSQGLQ